MPWNSLMLAAIDNCCNYTKILQKINTIPVDFASIQAEASLEEATTCLQDIGLVTKRKRMLISELLNPINEDEYSISHMPKYEEIFNEKANEDGGDKPKLNEQEPQLPLPPILGVKKAFSTILNYLLHSSTKEAVSLNDHLASYTRILVYNEVNTMKQTTFLSYLSWS
ncbi:hypothetical protein O181_118123 [Austropuccinia psidii MF-1]|uniref:Uncharacterized protein n=1 Tax=Austropuccinia psidii MF-1 TaxID=1389203 RepID=A0A9Q3KBM4_9BASI|nr:hypothetical protein [Austropuccinia psidii MF-1]